MIQASSTSFKLGILGGGQLGKMLCQAASKQDIAVYILDPALDCPSAPVTNQVIKGNFNDFDDVYNFGKSMDALTIEIEHVNVEALEKLQSEGIIIEPNPQALKIIKDKGLQKDFYKNKNIPTSPYELLKGKSEILNKIEQGELTLPFVQKSRTGGYDGQGVAVIKNQDDLSKIMDCASVIENAVDIDREISVIAARNREGEIKCFPPVEMEFNSDANLVEKLFCPSTLTEEQIDTCTKIAQKTIESFNICGLLAVELFLDKDGHIMVNEVAPRPHNSGHHTIESAFVSQYEQHIRGILGFPLGNTDQMRPAVMVNVLGEPGFNGPTKFEGLDTCMQLKGVHLHFYGKKETRPFRKMGHVTVVGSTMKEAFENADIVKKHLKVIA